MRVLSDKTMHDLLVTHRVSFDAIRAIEAAVLEAQSGQEEVGYVGEYVLPTKNLKAGTPLYAAPVVQPDMIRPDQEALQQIIAAALYDFGGFITTRQKQLVASATDNAADTVEALKEFMEKRGINPCQDVPVLSWQCWIAAAEGKSNANVCGLPHGKEDK